MLVNLSDVLSEQHKTIDKEILIEMTEVQTPFGSFPILKKDTLHLVVEHVKERELLIRGQGSLSVEIPCDRCLEPVEEDFTLDFIKNVDLDMVSDDGDENLDEKNYIDGYNLDVDKLLYNEILIGWPMKILCSDACKGICNTCGQNLNKGTCSCEETSLDPRMSVIRDVFKNFKEV